MQTAAGRSPVAGQVHDVSLCVWGLLSPEDLFREEGSVQTALFSPWIHVMRLPCSSIAFSSSGSQQTLDVSVNTAGSYLGLRRDLGSAQQAGHSILTWGTSRDCASLLGVSFLFSSWCVGRGCGSVEINTQS